VHVCCNTVRREVVLADNNSTAVYARLKTNLTLPCGLPGDNKLIAGNTSLIDVMWFDYVHNFHRNPLLIFSSRNNPSRHIHRQHPQQWVSV